MENCSGVVASKTFFLSNKKVLFIKRNVNRDQIMFLSFLYQPQNSSQSLSRTSNVFAIKHLIALASVGAMSSFAYY